MVRYVLPAVVVLGGLVVMSFGDENHLEGGAGIVSAGLANAKPRRPRATTSSATVAGPMAEACPAADLTARR
jgi:hypothetical protein